MLRAEWAGDRIPAGARELSSSPKHPDLLWVTEVRRVRRPGHEDNHWPLPNVEVEKECSCVSTPPILCGFMVGQGQRYIYKCRVSVKLLHNAEWWIGKGVTGSGRDLCVVPSRQLIRIKTESQDGRNRHLRRTRQKNRQVIAQSVRIQLWKFKHTMSQNPVLTHED